MSFIGYFVLVIRKNTSPTFSTNIINHLHKHTNKSQQVTFVASFNRDDANRGSM